MAKMIEQEELGGVNIIAPGTTLTGDIVTTGDCRIDGTVKGNVSSNAKIIIGKNGSLEGEVRCKSIDIEGFVKANINATELLSLKATANLSGNIHVGKISIEPGANFVGNCTMQNTQTDIV
ncbi:MAG TPA: polymer-forming cytoskeletal protein [Bacteroidales bacterium]|nr:polymer-forming cytoskeletal protein [Bacteroidales bacterium]